jgi:hypothetical protein
MADVIRVVNQNRAMIHSLYSTRASVSTPGFPALKATLAVGSPHRIRLQAGTGIAGSELDLGSNEQLFWIWIKRSEPQAMFVGYHDRLVDSAARQMIPVEPQWLIEAIGLVYLDPNLQLEGPWRRPDGRLEVRSRVPSPEGIMTKTLVLDGRSGWVYEQHLYDARGKLLASAINSKHVLDPATGATLPYQTDIKWHPTNRSLTLQFHEVQINPPQLGQDLWTKPEYPGYPNVDVTQPRAPAGLSPQAPQFAPQMPATAWRGQPAQPLRRY